MSGSTISTTITQTVMLGSAGYLSPLTVTSTGAVLPTAYGATGLYVPSTVADANPHFSWNSAIERIS